MDPLMATCEIPGVLGMYSRTYPFAPLVTLWK